MMTQLDTNGKAFIAIVGSGYWGKNLVRNYYQIGALKIICDRNESILNELKTHYPETEVSSELTDVLGRDDVNGVVIATPANTHFVTAREALLANKHVYVEKPLVLQEDEGKELINLATRSGLHLMVGHLLQYHPAFVRLKELATHGELGRINYIYSTRLNFGKIRREENILWSFAPHDISMILSLVGEEPESVLTTGANFLHEKIADVTTTHLEFPSGIKAHIFVSWLHPYKEQNLVVVGDRKMAVFNDTLPWSEKLCLYPHRIKWENNAPVPAKAEPEYVDVSRGEPLRLECEHFLNCITNGETPQTDGHEGLRVLKILNASQHSLDEKGKKIFLTEVRSRQKTVNREELPATSYEPRAKAQDAFVHPTAVVDENVTIGDATKIWHFTHILSGSQIGERCNIGQNVVIGPDVTIGNGCKIQNNVSVYKGVTLEDGVFCGPSMVFTNVYNPRAEIRKMDQVRPTLVKKGTTIGANATIICGTALGRYAFIGAGSVVTKDVPDHALVVGNSARRIGWVCQCGETLSEDLKCRSCGKAYKENADAIEQR
jgi:UDP-2-acetamido-3-amino-2,3-dideoxy-glucuronate N-acetyltransferase